MPALSLRSGRSMVLTALLASALGMLLLAPATFAGGSPAEDEYCPIAGCPDDSSGGSNPTGRRSPPGGGPDSGANSGSNAGEVSLGPDPSVSPADEGASGGGSDGGGSDLSTDSGSSEEGFSSDSADDKDSKSLNGRSLGELLSGGTERVAKPAASTDAGTRAGKAVSEDGGGAGLLWLLLALGAVTAVAAGGVAVRRRQARQGYLG